VKHPVIETRGIKKAYKMGSETLWALKGVDAKIEQGEFVAVMGPSGSGKSTFMNMIGCLDAVSEGQVFIDGRDVSSLSARELAEVRNEKIGFVFQQFNLLPRTTALENVTLPLLYSHVDEAEWSTRATKCLELVDLAARMDHHPSQLSGGQQQRVAIARALVNQPVMVLADEPTGALDTNTTEEIMRLFQELNDQGTTIILVTHEPDVAAYAKRQMIFRDGLLVADDFTENLKTLDIDRALEIAELKAANE
jgi:putative ABC transport system ATP-binding protein